MRIDSDDNYPAESCLVSDFNHTCAKRLMDDPAEGCQHRLRDYARDVTFESCTPIDTVGV